MEMQRAYSVLEVKDVDEDARVITGIATTPTPDRMADVVLPEGAVFKLPLPLLWQHNPGAPIGHVTQAKVTKKGIEIVAEIAKGVHEDIERAWKYIRAGLVRGLSIGFRGLDTEQIPNSWGVIFEKWEWLELSAVTIPANAEATITSVKKFDTGVEKSADPEIPQRDTPAPQSKKGRVVSLKKPAEGSAAPFVLRKIKRTK